MSPIPRLPIRSPAVPPGCWGPTSPIVPRSSGRSKRSMRPGRKRSIRARSRPNPLSTWRRRIAWLPALARDPRARGIPGLGGADDGRRGRLMVRGIARIPPPAIARVLADSLAPFTFRGLEWALTHGRKGGPCASCRSLWPVLSPARTVFSCGSRTNPGVERLRPMAGRHRSKPSRPAIFPAAAQLPRAAK